MKNNLSDILITCIAISVCLAFGKLVFSLVGGLPASLYGMIILNILLTLGIFKAERLKGSITWCINNMGVCFVPAGVGIINYFDLVAKYGLEMMFIICTTTLILISIVGLMADKFISNKDVER